MFKLTISALLLGLTVAPAFASYQLALMYDLDRRAILRYDTVNNISLGYFGAQYQGQYGAVPHILQLDPINPGRVLTMDFNATIREIDYSTGILQNVYHSGLSLVAPSSFRALANGNIVRSTSTGTSIFSRSSTTALNTFASFTNFTTIDTVQRPDGGFFSLERQDIGGGIFNYHVFSRNTTGGFSTNLSNVLTNSNSTTALSSMTL